ncbi:MAG: hypothetical protein D6796_10065 [Caldilineae bacterium]|nr:MAG: hypothetical protein D6796_10065 [Caldilineae bacterium]
MSLFQAAFRIIDLPPTFWHEVPEAPPRPPVPSPRQSAPSPRRAGPRFPRLRLLATVLRVAVVTAVEDAMEGLRQGGARLAFAAAGATLPRMAFA